MTTIDCDEFEDIDVYAEDYDSSEYFTPEAIEGLSKFIPVYFLEEFEVQSFINNTFTNLIAQMKANDQHDLEINSYIVSIKVNVGKEAAFLKSDIKFLANDEWITIVNEHMTPSQGRTLCNYMRIAKAKVNPKYYYLGIYEILRILTATKGKNIDFNEFVENGLGEAGLDLRKKDEDEYKRHLNKRVDYFVELTKFEKNKIVLTDLEKKELVAATDNNYKTTNKDLDEFKKLKMNGTDLTNILKNKKLPQLPQKTKSTLNIQAEIANFRERLLFIISAAESADEEELNLIDGDLRADLLEKLNKAIILLTAKENQEGPSVELDQDATKTENNP